MLNQATRNLLNVARDSKSTDEEFKAATQAFINSIGGLSVDDASEAVGSLAGLFDLNDASRAGFAALLCGAFVEQGCNPLVIAQPLTKRLHSLLEMAVELNEACVARAPDPAEGADDSDNIREMLRKQLSSEMPERYAAWERLKQFWRPAIAVFSRSAESRAAARDLRRLASKIADDHEGGHWLRLMLSVLDDEPILVIEPGTKLGILARISGVVENFQLNVLLMDRFPQSDASTAARVSESAAEVARGEGPQSTDETVLGVWNLYTWKGAAAGGTLPDPKDISSKDSWIWNEGIPEDIPVFKGRRVILLGPQSYVRTWRSQRMFAGLPASFRLERSLSEAEVDDWLAQMVTANNGS
jgi:hypothetical protein